MIIISILALACDLIMVGFIIYDHRKHRDK